MFDPSQRHQPGPFHRELPNGRHVALGRPGVHRDRRTLQLHRYLNLSQLPALEPKVDNSSKAKWILGHNDAVGDCVQVGRCNHVLLAAALSNQTVNLTDDDAVTAYEQLCGYQPGNADSDQGCVELDTLNHWTHDAPIAGVSLEAFVEVVPQSDTFETIRYAIQIFGSCYIGLSMPAAWQNSTGPGRMWDIGPNVEPDYAPNSWGGHCVILVGYDWTGPKPTFTAITWAEPQLITRDAMASYCDERYALLTNLWRQHVPQGLIDFTQLSTDLQNIRSAA